MEVLDFLSSFLTHRCSLYHPLYFPCLKYFITGCLQRESVRPGYVFLPLVSCLRAGVERNCLALLRESRCLRVPVAQLSLCLSPGWSAELTVTNLDKHVRDLHRLKKPPFPEERLPSLGDRTKPVEQSLPTRLCP